MPARPLGAPVRRKEDPRILTDKRNLTDDIERRNRLFVIFVRSPHGHAQIGPVDVQKPRPAPSMIAVDIGTTIADAGLGSVPCGWGLKSKDVAPMDYGVLRAHNLPAFTVAKHGRPSTHTSLRDKGCGKAGTIGAPDPAMTAVIDVRPLSASRLFTMRNHASHAGKLWRTNQQHRKPRAA